MKITIECEAKEIAELRALALPVERLIDSKFADVKESPTDIKIKSLLDESIFLDDADTRQQIIKAVMNAVSEAMYLS